MRSIIQCFAPLLFVLLFYSCSSGKISGDLKVWHKVSIDFDGPELKENGNPNPFTDFRLDVTFEGPDGQTFSVPGFFAADGNSSESGNVWRVNFTPNSAGVWRYSVSFVRGEMIAADLNGGASAGFFDGSCGKFTVGDNDNMDPKDFRSKGKLEYVGEHFLRFAGSGEYFLKAGANSPEVFLEYQDFDNTPSLRAYPDHIQHWKDGDPVWGNGKGKGIIGAVNYLSGVGINALYFLTMNAYGDGKNAYPWIHRDSIFIYDCSKLAQWEIVIQHMTKMGVMPHFVLTETENEAYFEIAETGSASGFADSRKIYYREMVARFGHHPAVTWNIGEENGWAEGTGYHTANTKDQREQFLRRMRKLIPYNDHLSIHNGPSDDDHIFNDLLGNKDFSGPAFQWGLNTQIHTKILEWRKKSADAGHKWVVSMDEAWLDPPTSGVPLWRQEAVWGTFMAGGAGVELYIGAGLDLKIQDYRPYEPYYKATVIAKEFIESSIPFEKMIPNDAITDNGWALSYEDSVYLVYSKNGGRAQLTLPENEFSVQWFDPVHGGEMVSGSVENIFGGDKTDLGNPPENMKNEWVCKLVKRK